MTYELAKQLKDAGFPQNGTPLNMVNYADLSELIEACGDDFRNLEKHDEEEINMAAILDIDSRWTAYGTEKERNDKRLALIPNYFGSTPEEAVANLWLALNKK